jgi:peptide/nickel transport system substrate-binding protein
LELLSGTIDLMENALSPDALERVGRDPRLAIESGEGNGYSYMGFNLSDPILKDLRVRRAIAHGIDREGILKSILRGTATLSTGVLSPGHWAYEPEVRLYPYSPKEAKRLLAEAGYPLPLRLSYKTSQNELARRVAEAIQQQLSEAGIRIDLRTYEWGTFYADIKSGNFQLYTLSWVGVNDPNIYYTLFHSESLPPAGANRGRYIDPLIDRWLEEGRRTQDRSLRAEIYRKVQKRIAEELPYVSLWHPKNIVVRKRELEGFVLFPGGDLISLKQVRRVGS